jgi:hypothetical protein
MWHSNDAMLETRISPTGYVAPTFLATSGVLGSGRRPSVRVRSWGKWLVRLLDWLTVLLFLGVGCVALWSVLT